MPPDDRLLPRARHPFDLSEPVGPRAPNRRDDVIKVETLLGNAGSDILDRTGGPTGWYGAAFDRALRDWQKSNDLKADGIANPGGPTVRAAQAKAPALAATRPATPDEVEAHHAARAAGRPGP
ncbi:MAG: peptidoglycan-binding protein, partial [Rhodobacterales bacterium]|nr:peptidoglycan-binding protein [Rhodobacterales bacterium]